MVEDDNNQNDSLQDTDTLNNAGVSEDPDETSASKPPRKKALDFAQETSVLSKDNPILRRALSNQMSGEDSDGEEDSSAAGSREIVLVIRGMVERKMLREGVEYKLGRYDLGATANDEIDLTPYGAQDRGVSRLHAQIHLEDDRLYLTDMGSTNGTYLGGKRLEPNTPSMIRKGDEILLGRLAIEIMFH